MKGTNWKEIAELFGTGAIVASLIFVGLEMRQTRKLAMAEAYQSRTDSELSITFATMQSDLSGQVSEKILTGEALTADEYREFRLILEARLSYWENAHYQWENALLTDEFWDANLASIKAFMLNQPARRYWNASRHLWREMFRTAIDEVMNDQQDGSPQL